jgi:hypothetical protein
VIGTQPLRVVDRYTVQELHREHTTRRQRVVNLGDHDEVEASRDEQLAEVIHRAGLVAQVDLLSELLAKTLDRLQQLDACFHTAAREPTEEGLEGVHVRRNELLDVRTQDLDRNGSTVLESCVMDDRERRRGDRSLVERREELADRASELALDRLPDRAERHGRTLIEEAAELLRPIVTEHSGGRADELSDLDVRPAEGLAASTHPNRDRGSGNRPPQQSLRCLRAEVPRTERTDADESPRSTGQTRTRQIERNGRLVRHDGS